MSVTGETSGTTAEDLGVQVDPAEEAARARRPLSVALHMLRRARPAVYDGIQAKAAALRMQQLLSQSRRLLAYTLLIVLVTVALSTPSAWGASGRSDDAPRQKELVSQLWSSLTAIWAKAVCIIEPHGGCATTETGPDEPPPSTDEGCILDPHGGCRPRS